MKNCKDCGLPVGTAEPLPPYCITNPSPPPTVHLNVIKSPEMGEARFTETSITMWYNYQEFYHKTVEKLENRKQID